MVSQLLGTPVALSLPPAEDLGGAEQLTDKGLTGNLPSGNLAVPEESLAYMTDQRESQGKGTCLPWGLGVTSCPPPHSCQRLFTLDTAPLSGFTEEVVRGREAEAEAGPGPRPKGRCTEAVAVIAPWKQEWDIQVSR